MSLVRVEDLRLVFDGFEGTSRVLDGIDLAIEPGETVGIVGETGCGKSVLARCLSGLIERPPARVVSGRVLVGGHDLLALPEAELRRLRGARIAMVFQDPATFLNPVLTIGTQLEDAIRAHDRARARPVRRRRSARTRAAELLAAVRLPDPAGQLDRYQHELSGGQRQRVLIAMALAGEPDLLVADEPTTALDVTIQAQVLRLIADLVARSGLTLVLISHDLGVVGAMCRRIVVLYAGTVVEDAPAAALLDRPLHPYTSGLLAALPDRVPLDRPLAAIPGTIPDLRDPPAGCRFHPRCPMAVATCRNERPALRILAADHRVACHRAGEP